MHDRIRSRLRPATLAVHTGRDPESNHGIVNPPVYHASTVLFPTVAALRAAQAQRYDRVYYGRYGTPTTFALEDAMAELEGGYRAIAVSSGLAAITTALLAYVKSGDHILMVDSVYAPSRKFCDGVLKGMGVATDYYSPGIGAGIAELIRPTTRVVFCESPGSGTFEVQDIPAIAAAIGNQPSPRPVLMLDNTWATPLGFRAFDHGVDVSIHAATKYVVGHSDVIMGIITAASETTWRPIKDMAAALGQAVAPDDCYLALRGLRTMPTRLERQANSALALASWLSARAEVARVLFPPLPGAPGHDLFRRDFVSASGLFGVELKSCSAEAQAAMLDGMRLFKMGFSWGGYESLILPMTPGLPRSAEPWDGGPLLRISVGLEDVADLILDLEDGFARLTAGR